MQVKANPRGRPRSEASRIAILTAARDILREVGYEGLTVVSVAARAVAGKQTVYRWWPTKAVLVADCVLEGLLDVTLITSPATGNAATDLTTWLTDSYAALSSDELAPLVHALTAASASDADAAARLSERFLTPLRSAFAEMLQRAVDAGNVRTDIDILTVSDLLIGALIFDSITRDPGAQARVPAMVDVLIFGLDASRNERRA